MSTPLVVPHTTLPPRLTTATLSSSSSASSSLRCLAFLQARPGQAQEAAHTSMYGAAMMECTIMLAAGSMSCVSLDARRCACARRAHGSLRMLVCSWWLTLARSSCRSACGPRESQPCETLCTCAPTNPQPAPHSMLQQPRTHLTAVSCTDSVPSPLTATRLRPSSCRAKSEM